MARLRRKAHLQSATVTHTLRIGIFILCFSGIWVSQQAPATPETKPGQPQVRVNYLNVCTPSDEEQAVIAATLDKLPAKPRFALDYEVSRGRSNMDESGLVAGANAKMSEQPASVSRWVRIRKEFPAASAISNVQYSFSVNEDKVVETLVFRAREQKDVIQISLSDNVQAPPNPAQVVATSTPVDRIRLERFGKTSVVLARCPTADQAKYEPLFQKASSLLSLYRQLLGVQRIVRELPPSSDSGKKPSEKPR